MRMPVPTASFGGRSPTNTSDAPTRLPAISTRWPPSTTAPACRRATPTVRTPGTSWFGRTFSSTLAAGQHPVRPTPASSRRVAQGYGMRDIIRFTTWIENIGELDYFIGQPSYDNKPSLPGTTATTISTTTATPEYLLFTENGTESPSVQNGFCVIDLGCNTGTANNGGNMGITAGCYDIYGASLACQWIDVTDIRTVPLHLLLPASTGTTPRQVGHIERDTLNNWAQVIPRPQLGAAGNDPRRQLRNLSTALARLTATPNWIATANAADQPAWRHRPEQYAGDHRRPALYAVQILADDILPPPAMT